MKKKLMFIVYALIVALSMASCATQWYGKGVVVTKQYDAPYMYMISCGKGVMCPMTHPECYKLIIKDIDGETHEGCVQPEDWERAVVGEEMTLVRPEDA